MLKITQLFSCTALSEIHPIYNYCLLKLHMYCLHAFVLKLVIECDVLEATPDISKISTSLLRYY